MKVSIKDISEPFDHKRSDLWSAISKAANTASDAGMDVKEIIDLIGSYSGMLKRDLDSFAKKAKADAEAA